MLFGDDVELPTSEVVSSRSHILVQYNGIRILYDLDDGYFTDAIKKDMTLCDYYFKRSYNTSLNKETGLDILGSKCLPLGFNYDVSLPGKFYGTDYGKLKNCLYRMMRVNKPENFEESPSYYPESGKPVILFSTRV